MTVPDWPDPYTPGLAGELQLDGRFAIATGTGSQGGTDNYLEECGAPLHQLLSPDRPAEFAPPVASNPHALVWQQQLGSLVVEFLPSRRRFTLRLPPAIKSYVTPALTNKRLYALEASPDGIHAGTLWTANFPTKPPAPRTHQSH